MKKGGRIRTLEYLLKTCEVGRVLEQRTHSPQEPWAGVVNQMPAAFLEGPWVV